MTLGKIIDTLKMIALKHPNVNSAYEGNIYDILNSKPDNKYASVVITQQSHTTDETYDHYGFVIFYVDRLVDDLEENRVQIQSIGKSMLGNIITAFCNEFDAECDNILYQPFTQRFTDETAGVYCTITIDTVKDGYCAERYWDESWSAPIVSIKNVDMSITLTDNGHYTLDYDPTIYTGIGKVDIDVEFNTEPYYNDGYGNGYNVGHNDGYNNGYGDGYDKGNEDGYDSGYDKGNEEGFANAETVIAEDAQVIEVNRNGYYLSKYADDVYVYPDIVTGDFGDGTYFYDWGDIKDGCYNTEVSYEEGTVIELWWKYKDSIRNYYIFGNGYDTTSDISLRYGDNSLYLRKGPNQFTIPIDVAIWQHIKIETNGFVYLNGNKVEGIDLSTISFTADDSPFLINCFPRDLGRYANGLFGMIKINDNIFIPKDGGFVNYRTEEQLGGYVKPTKGTYNYIESNQVTGYFDDGTPFYGYAVLNKVYFNTNVIPNNDTNLEIWWKDDGVMNMYATIIGTQQDGKGADGILKFCEYTANQNRWEFDTQNGTFPRDTNWHHLVLNKTSFYYDGEKYADVNGSLKETVVPIVINGLGLNPDITHTSNGYFGMVKIDGKTFIPTENGYVDIDTQELLPSNWISENVDVPFVGEYIFTENPIVIYEGEGNLFKSVYVNTPPFMNVEKLSLKFGHSQFTTIPKDLIDWSTVYDMSYMFQNCGKLVDLTGVNTYKATNMESAFGATPIVICPPLNTSNVTNMRNLFIDCSKLEEVEPMDTSKVTTMYGMFNNFSGEYPLRKLPEFDCSSLTDIGQYFAYSGYQNKRPKLTDCGGWKNIKCNWNDGWGLNHCPNLTYESCINILNGLYDFTGNGMTPSSSQGKLKVHQNFLDTVGEEITIGTNKGWTITA